MSRYVQYCTADLSPNLSWRKQLQVPNFPLLCERRHSSCVSVNLVKHTKKRLEAHALPQQHRTLHSTQQSAVVGTSSGRRGCPESWRCIALCSNIQNWLWRTIKALLLWTGAALPENRAVVGLPVKPRSDYRRHAALGKWQYSQFLFVISDCGNTNDDKWWLQW